MTWLPKLKHVVVVKEPVLEAVYSLLKTQYSLALNKVRGLG